MREDIVINKVYKFNELSEEAREYAINQYRQSTNDYWFINEADQTLDKFCSIFGIKYRLIDYEEPHRNEYNIELEDNIKELSGLRLRTYIINNYYSYLFTKKYLKSGGVVDKPLPSHRMRRQKQISCKCSNFGKYSISYYSNIQMTNGCTLTGTCYDMDILQPIYDFLNKPNKNLDFETLLNDCVYSLCHTVQSEIEYENSDEAIIGNILANDYEFLENGKLY